MYVFAATEEAVYVSRHVDSRISFTNHIPIELLGESSTNELADLD
jgi:hypothetical protein